MEQPELVRWTGMSPRQVRYLVSEKLIPAHTGDRAHASHGDEHVDAIQRYIKLKRLGFSPASIRIQLEARQGVPFPTEGGITLVIPPELLLEGEGPPNPPILRKRPGNLAKGRRPA